MLKTVNEESTVEKMSRALKRAQIRNNTWVLLPCYQEEKFNTQPPDYFKHFVNCIAMSKTQTTNSYSAEPGSRT